MKRLTTCAVVAIALTAGIADAAVPAKVRILNQSGSVIYFQPESSLNFNEVTSPDTLLSVEDSPVYYRLMDENWTFYPVFLTPGSETEIRVTANGVSITGGNDKENAFMRENTYLCYTPESIKPYSKEWVDYNETEILRLDSVIDAAGLDPEFSAVHKLYNRFIFLNQRLGGMTLNKLFSKDGEDIKTDNGFYDFLETLSFDDERLLMVPKWFDVVEKAIETKEARGMIPVSNDDYMSIYAKEIGNEKVRSHFLVALLDKTLKYNYLNDFKRQLPVIRPLITDAAAANRIPELEKMYEEKVRESANVKEGMEMPDFTCNDIDGKEYRLSDMRGDYVIVDFWFTGCVPCRAEMPYFDELAKSFDGKGVRFVSLSLDTGDALYGKWVELIRKKPHAPGVLSVNLPGGFNSPLLKTLNIKGVPRIMLLDREGKIVESYAKRPSDPKLRQQLEKLTSAICQMPDFSPSFKENVGSDISCSTE